MQRARFGLSKRSLPLLAAALVLLLAAVAAARPGSGHSYSGSSRSSGRGYGGGGGDGSGIILELVIWLLFRNPAIGIPILLIVAAVAIVQSIAKSRMKGWSTTPNQIAAVAQRERQVSVPRIELARIRSIDPEFSVVLFEDFVYLLYAAFQRARATGMSSIRAYVAPELAQTLEDPTLLEVHGIIIGALRLVRFSGTGGPTISVEIEVEANFVERPRSGADRRYYVVVRLLLERSAKARSR